MSDPIITCPHCQGEIKLNESLAGPLIAQLRSEFAAKLAIKDEEVTARQAELDAAQHAIAAERQSIDETVALRVEQQRRRLVEEEARKARALLADEIHSRDEQLAHLTEIAEKQEAKLAEAQAAQAELLKKQRELDDARRELELTVQRRVLEESGAIREQAKREAEESLVLKVREKEEQIASMQQQIEVLKQKAEQGSQQLQGEVQEIALEATLRERFLFDLVEPVPKGEFGGDILQRVITPSGQVCGTILWETKRTRSWIDGWLVKLRNDQRSARADGAVLVTHAVPKGFTGSFGLIDGVWVTEPKCAIPLAIALRESLIALSGARVAADGQQTKAEMVYRYLTGPRFRQRVEAIVERFTEMHADLARERKAMNRLWAKREEQIRGVIETTAGMYGDLQGIAGKSLEEIDGLDILAVGEGDGTGLEALSDLSDAG